MFKTSILIGAGLLAAVTTHLSQEPVEAAARPAIAFSGDVVTSFEVRDLKASVRWYQEVLGCEVFLDLTEMGWCEVTTPVTKSLIGLGFPEEGRPVTPSGGARLSFGVEDIESARARLEAFGVETAEIVELPDLVKLLEFTDPDGNRLMFHEDLQSD